MQIKENTDKRLDELGPENTIKDIIFQILSFISRSNQKDQLALKVSQAVVNSLFATSESPLCREVLSLLLEKLCSLSTVARKDVIWWLVYALDSRKFNVPVIRSLLEVNLINISELDSVLVTAIDNSMEGATKFAIGLIRDAVLSDNPLLMRLDFIRTLKRLRSFNTPETNQFFKEYESTKILPVAKSTNVTRKEKMALVFTEWVKLLKRVDSSDIATIVFIKQLMDRNVLDTSDKVIEFVKAATELSVNSFKESDPTSEVFVAIDALSKLIIKLLVLQDFSEVTRSEYLNLIFSIITLAFSKDHSLNGASFNERPYFRLFSSLLCEWEYLRGHKFINVKDQTCRKELISFDEKFYSIFASFLHAYQPIAFPGFSFAWVTLISHRMFLPRLLRLPDKKGWPKLILLLVDLLRFMSQYTTKDDIPDSVSVVYKGTLRIFIAISNDAPEFLVENHYELINNLPPTYIQLKNVILATFPSKMLVPDPFDPELVMENVELCQQPPAVFYDPVQDLKGLKKPVDNYLRIPSSSLMRTISSGIYRSEYRKENGLDYDITSVDTKLLNAIVLHVGIEAAIEKQKTSATAIFNTKSSYYTLLENLISDGTTEVKFQVIQAMVNHLRYPNAHTLWFNYVLKRMFSSDAWGEQTLEVQEIIVRSLLERIITNKPHCWGVVVTFTDFLKSEEFKLLELPFVKEIPEIELIFKNLSKYVVVSKQAQDGPLEKDNQILKLESRA